MHELSFDEMKLIELDIMSEIDRICRVHDIPYYLAYGTCLGAIRHGGFIPWDDDIDIVMMRADYERFFEIFEQEKQVKHYQLVSARDNSATCAFGKVVDTTTRVEENYSTEEYALGVWVDIFPYDSVPDQGEEDRIKKITRLGYLRYLIITDASSGGSVAIRLAKKIICPLVKHLNPCKYARQMDDLAKECDAKYDTAYVADLVADYADIKRYPLHCFVPMEIDFEDRKFFIPKHYDELLTMMYGVWQTPPDESNREPHTAKAYRL